MKVRVYFNLTKKVFSIQEKNAGSWRVVRHMSEVFLTNVKFICYDRFISKQKVCTCLFWRWINGFFPINCPVSQITYNPAKFPTRDKSGKYTYETELTSNAVLDSFWDITRQRPYKECKYLKLSLIDKVPYLLALHL